MKEILKPILIFLGIQFLCALVTLILGGLVTLLSPVITFEEILLPAVAWGLLLADPVILWYFWKKGWLTSLIEERKKYEIDLFDKLFIWGIATLCFFFIMDGLLPFITFSGGEEEEWGLLSGLTSHPAGILSITIFGPIAEEVLFRGMILRILLRRTEPFKAILGSAFIFAVIHGNIDQFTYCLFFGTFIGYAYYKTANLYLCMGMHILNNSIVILYAHLFPETDALWELFPEPFWYGILCCVAFSFLVVILLKQAAIRGVKWEREKENEIPETIETPE